MKLTALLLLLCATCVAAQLEEGPEKKRKEERRTRPSRIVPKLKPEDIKDGIHRRRRSRLDLRDFRLDDDEDLELQLMDDEPPMRFHLKMFDDDDEPFTAFSSVNDTTGDSVTFVTSRTRGGRVTVMGTVHNANGTIFQVRQLADKELVVEEVLGGFDPEFESTLEDIHGDKDLPPPITDVVDGYVENSKKLRGLQSGKGRRLSDDGSVLDVMVLYTKGAMCAAAGFGSGGKCADTATNAGTIEGIINLAVAETNTAYLNSNIPTKLRLVKTHFDRTYNDYSNGWEATLSFMKGSSDGQMDYLHAMRNQFGADFVVLLVDSPSYCGIGFRPDNPTANDAFSVAKWSCATGYYSFGHEMAHNMGCNHDKNSAGGGIGSNYGYQFTGGSSYNSRFRTIMSYDCANGCPRVQRFSDPLGTWNGRPAGDSGANNAGWIRARLAKYAQFRPAQPISGTNVQLPVINVKLPTASPTMPPSNQRMIQSTFDGGFIGAAGGMFDIRAKKDLTVHNFAVHSYAATEVDIDIFKKKTPGSCQGVSMKKDEWEWIGSVTFVTQDALKPSILPPRSFAPVFVKSGAIQAFYIQFQEGTNYNRYSGGTKLGAVYKENDDIQILEGYAKGYNFGDDYYPRMWNGQVYYEIGTTRPPASTSRPTRVPVSQPVVVPTPLPTNAVVVNTQPPSTPATLSRLQTTFAGGNGQAGNMFDVTTNKAIVIRSFDIHTYSTSSVRVLIFTKKGTHVGSEKNPAAWTQICDTRVFGKGSPIPTPIPKEAISAVNVAAGETQSFYVTLTESKIRYTNTAVVAFDGTLKVTLSSGNKYPFGDSYINRMWNGAIYYEPAGSQLRRKRIISPADASYGPLKIHKTTFANKNGSYGSMWDIKAKENLVIRNLWIHTYHQFGQQVEVEVYKVKAKNATFEGKSNKPDDWELVGTATVEGQGTGVPTKLPTGSLEEIKVNKGEIQGLYVTIIGGGLRYTNGKSTSTLLPFSETADMIVYEGAGIGEPRFGGVFNGRIFNGAIEYYTPNAKTVVSSSDVGSVGIGVKFEEGWPCEKDEDCKSGKCANNRWNDENESISVQAILEDEGERTLANNQRLCLNEKGLHDEDGEYGNHQ